jgi:hypothetical protein
MPEEIGLNNDFPKGTFHHKERTLSLFYYMFQRNGVVLALFFIILQFLEPDRQSHNNYTT